MVLINHHDLVNCYGISVSKTTTDMFSWSYSQCRSHLSFMTYNRIFNTSCTACTNNGIETAYSFAKLAYVWFVMGIRITRVFFVWSLYCLSIFDLLLMITSLVSYDYLFGILWLPLWYIMITSLVSYDYLFGILWLPLWYLQAFLTWYLIMLCLFLSFLFWWLFCLSFFHLRFLIPPFGILKLFF